MNSTLNFQGTYLKGHRFALSTQTHTVVTMELISCEIEPVSCERAIRNGTVISGLVHLLLISATLSSM